MHAVAGAFQHRAQERADRALAVRARNMNHRRNAPFRMTEPFQQSLDTIQYEIDAFGVQRQKPLQDGVAALGSRHDPFLVAATSGADCLVRIRSNVASRAFSSWRCTIMSSMPCSSRYSAR